MNSTIKRVLLSVVLLQTACQSVGAVTLESVKETAQGYWNRVPSVSMPSFSMPSMPSKDVVLSYVPSKETVFSYVPSKETVKSYIPSKDAVLAYIPSKETVMSYVPASVGSKYEAVMQHATAKNGAIVAGTAVTLAALYAGYKIVTSRYSKSEF